jgi:hypothetical protein
MNTDCDFCVCLSLCRVICLGKDKSEAVSGILLMCFICMPIEVGSLCDAQLVIHEKLKMVKSSKRSVYCLQSLGMKSVHCDLLCMWCPKCP